ncbi:MAG: hypothetical protein II736_04705, partial [Clostridia bacterium]|nr:hypothetical protein [Clostridia bacterium]
MKKIVILALAMALILPLLSCAGNGSKEDGGKESGTETETETETAPSGLIVPQDGTYMVLDSNEDMYFTLDSDDMTWKFDKSSASGEYMGKYRIGDGVLYADGPDGNTLFELSILSDHSFSVTSPVGLLTDGTVFILRDFGNDPHDKPEPGYGIYSAVGDEMGPYLWLDPENNSWRIGPGLVASAGFGGTYRIENGAIYADFENVTNYLVFEILSDHSVRALKTKEWITEWTTYVLRDYDNVSSSLEPVCSADEALEWAKSEGALVYENGEFTNTVTWDDFYASVLRKEPAILILAEYESPDGVGDRTPRLTFYYVVFSGEDFVVFSRKSDEENAEWSENYLYLRRFNVDPGGDSRPGSFYLLTDDLEVTFNEIMEGMYSSDSHDLIKHF